MLRRCLTCTCSSHFPRRVLLSSFASSSTSSPSSSGFVTDRIRSDGLNWLKTEETQRKLFVKENERTRAYLRDTEDLRQRLYKELACYQNQANSDSSLHDVVAEEDEEEDGDYIYYSTRAEEKGVHRLCRRHKTSQKEQVLIDLQALAEEHGWASLHGLKISQDQSKVAFLVELGQSREEYTCIARDLSVPGAPEHVISKRAVSIEWGKDHRYLYHTKPDELGRPYQVCRTDLQPLWEGGLGSKDTKKENAFEHSAKEEIVYSETDPNYYLDLSVTKDWEYLTITSVSRTSSEVRVIAMGEKAIETEKQCSSPEMILLRGREEGIEYYVEHNRGMFFMLSNCYNPKSGYKLFVTSAQGAHRLQEKWQELRWDEEGAKIDGMGEELVDMEMFKNFVVLYGRTSRGQASIKVMHLEGLPNVVKVEEVPLDRSTPIALHHGVNKEFDSEVLSFSVSTPVHNLANFRYNMTSATLEGAGNHHTENRLFDCKLLEIQSRDGTNIPVTLVFSKAHPPSRSSPLLMQVYAAYGMNLEPQYDVSHFPLLKRGWCQVLVHARGGGECGKSWHRQAKMKNKEKSMEDFQDVYHYFVANHYCDPDLVAAKVHSAGGLVLGATINQHPTMFKSVITNAPFVDLLSVMTDSSLPHTVSEYEEWGNPAVEEELEYMAKYCPYFNVRSNTALYPAILATSSSNDVRVPFWVVCKWIHRIRNNQAQVGQARPVLLRGDLDANHFGKTGPDGAVVEASIENAFLIKTVTS